MKVIYGSIIGKIIHKFGFYGITFGDTVYSGHDVLTEVDLKHEYCHTLQYKKYGFVGFLVRYLWWSLRYGYHKNPLEVEAYDYEINGPALASTEM